MKPGDKIRTIERLPDGTTWEWDGEWLCPDPKQPDTHSFVYDPQSREYPFLKANSEFVQPDAEPNTVLFKAPLGEPIPSYLVAQMEEFWAQYWNRVGAEHREPKP